MSENWTTDYRELVIKFLAGEISDGEMDVLKEWLEKDPANRRIFNEENELWQISGLKTKKELNIDVLGTSFNVVSYSDETQSEVILIEGKVKLSAEDGQVTKEYGTMHTGQRAVYKEEFQKVCTEEVNPKKYIAWRDGNLIFQDDSMEDVVKRLNRWFNVEIIIEDPEIDEYIYKATFRNENLRQVLNLLKISAPIDYRIIESKVLPDGEFTKQKIFLMKKNK